MRQRDLGFVNYYTASTGRTKEPPTCEVRPREKEKEGKAKEQSEKTTSKQELTACQAQDSKAKQGQELEQDQEQDHEKRELARLSREQARMDAEYRRLNGILEPRSPSPSPSPAFSKDEQQPALDDGDTAHELEQHDPFPEPLQPPKKRERHFCLLPYDAENNSWVKVPMDGVDEVGAHCGLFVPGLVYERLVGDVAGRVEAWVGEGVSWRVAEEPEVVSLLAGSVRI